MGAQDLKTTIKLYHNSTKWMKFIFNHNITLGAVYFAWPFYFKSKQNPPRHPTQMVPHFTPLKWCCSFALQQQTSKSSSSLIARLVMTTPLLNSSIGLRRSAVRSPLLSLISEPQRSWNVRWLLVSELSRFSRSLYAMRSLGVLGLSLSL